MPWDMVTLKTHLGQHRASLADSPEGPSGDFSFQDVCFPRGTDAPWITKHHSDLWAPLRPVGSSTTGRKPPQSQAGLRGQGGGLSLLVSIFLSLDPEEQAKSRQQLQNRASGLSWTGQDRTGQAAQANPWLARRCCRFLLLALLIVRLSFLISRRRPLCPCAFTSVRRSFR